MAHAIHCRTLALCPLLFLSANAFCDASESDLVQVPFRVSARQIKSGRCWVIWGLITKCRDHSLTEILAIEPRLRTSSLGRIAPGQLYERTQATLTCFKSINSQESEWQCKIQPGASLLENVFGDYDPRLAGAEIATGDIIRKGVIGCLKSDADRECSTTTYGGEQRLLTISPFARGVSIQDHATPDALLATVFIERGEVFSNSSITRTFMPERTVRVGGINALVTINSKKLRIEEFDTPYPIGGRVFDITQTAVGGKTIIAKRLSDDRVLNKTFLYNRIPISPLKDDFNILDAASTTMRFNRLMESQFASCFGSGACIPRIYTTAENKAKALLQFHSWKQLFLESAADYDVSRSFEDEINTICGWSRLLRVAIALRDIDEIVSCAKGLCETCVKCDLADYCIYCVASLAEVLDFNGLGNLCGSLINETVKAIPASYDTLELRIVCRESRCFRFSETTLAACSQALLSQKSGQDITNLRIARIHSCLFMLKVVSTAKVFSKDRRIDLKDVSRAQLMDLVKNDLRELNSNIGSLSEGDINEVHLLSGGVGGDTNER